MQKEDSLSVTAYNLILDRILKFSLTPGAYISDFSLSKELGISRTPVREAILRLVDDGLVFRKGHGFLVAEITESEIVDLYDARASIETAMLRLALQKGIEDEELQKLRSYNEKLQECIADRKIIESLDYDYVIHRRLAHCSKNVRLQSFFDRIEKQVMRMSVFSVAQDNQFASDEHERIFLAIENSDIQEACDALERNIMNAKEQHLFVLKNSMKEGWLGIAKFVYKSPVIE